MSASTLKDTMETPSVPMIGQKSYGSIDPSSESGHLGGSTAISGQSHGEVYELPQHVNCNGIMGRSRIIAIGMVLLLGFAISTTHSRWTGNNSYNRDRGRNPKDGRNTVLQDLRGVVRTHSFCDMLGEVVFPKCGLLIKCFKNSESLYEWSTCMEHMVHASMHGLIGGGFNCNTDMEGFIKANPDYSRGLLTFALVYIVGAVWPSNTLMSDYNTCDSSCLHEQKVSCGCTCLTDPFAWTDHEVRVFMSSSMKVLSKCSGSHLWMDFNKEFEWPLGFKQDGKRLPEDRTLFLLRTMMVIACEPGSIGAMGTGSSPLDPIFWVLHPVFEKALHVVNLCPRYADTFDFTWVASSCFGSDYKDQLPFTEKVLGLGNGTEFLTNRDLVKLFHPSSGRLTYMYDDFLSWGTCHDWDPCPECSSDA